MSEIFMKSKPKLPVFNLDDEEQALSDAFDRGEWKSVDNLKEELVVTKEAAANYLRKNARINIRLSITDLERIKQLAAYEGLPYQTLIASILHKYAAGHPEKHHRHA
jgi:predicted DNA binding CopG/RHH family protein